RALVPSGRGWVTLCHRSDRPVHLVERVLFGQSSSASGKFVAARWSGKPAIPLMKTAAMWQRAATTSGDRNPPYSAPSVNDRTAGTDIASPARQNARALLRLLGDCVYGRNCLWLLRGGRRIGRAAQVRRHQRRSDMQFEDRLQATLRRA